MVEILTVIVIVAGLIGGALKLRALPLAAQIAAKDQVIATWEQNANADKERIGALERSVQSLTSKLGDAQQTIARLQGQVEQLEKFSAPEAVQRFEKQQEVMIGILRGLAEHNGVADHSIRSRGL